MRSTHWAAGLVAGLILSACARQASVESTGDATGGLRVRFQAVAGKSYSLQQRDFLKGGMWLRLIDVAPRTTNQIIEVSIARDARSLSQYLRLVTPQQP